jgi:hypothetical protein
MARVHLGFTSIRFTAFDGACYNVWITTCADIGTLPLLIARAFSPRIPTIESLAPYLRTWSIATRRLVVFMVPAIVFAKMPRFFRGPYAPATPSM